MILNRIYYWCKPMLPQSVRVALRRQRAQRRLRLSGEVWPIDEKAGATPPNWPGWPGGKRFAVVMTHDVEGQKGLDRVERVMQFETEHGFRSSFNFVPEGQYRVSDALRETMERAGFETGIHGLKHDGKLFSSKAEFARRARQIRQYAKNWNASGFRAPFMQHRLSWLHELGVAYDSSTFDTDPFEPEPFAVGTIFPFWVPGPDGSGYVELPYTLVQDFNLFVVLRQKNIDIWKRKVDWVAEHGGMVLLDTHPDYMGFDGSKAEPDEYPAEYYGELLSYIKDRYRDSFWSALPREVASCYTEKVPAESRNTRRKIAMVSHSIYETDNRVRRYAEALAKRGDYVEVFAISADDAAPRTTEISGVTVHRMNTRKHTERTKWGYAWRLLRFLVRSSKSLTQRDREIQYDLVHIHNVPDFLVFGAWYVKWFGAAKLILDIHDIVPEFFASKFGANEAGFYVKFLKFLEKRSAAFADHVIISNHIWQERMVSRSVASNKCSVFVNNVDQGIFYRHLRTRNDGKCIVLFPGGFQWHQGLDIGLRAFALLKRTVPDAEFHFYGGGGDGQAASGLAGLAEELGLNGSVKFCGRVSLDRMPEVMANADLGVVPKRAATFGNEAYSTKIMEFMSQGVPVVASRTKIDSLYFDDSVIRFFPSGDETAMAAAMLDVIENKPLRESLVSNGFAYVERNSWDTRRYDYFRLVDTLLTEPFPSRQP